MNSIEITDQHRTLEELETVIQRGLDTFVEVGHALLEIRDRRLYRELGFSSFENYCQDRWMISRQRGYQLIGAAAVVGNLSTVVDILLTERQARELVRLSPEEQREVAATLDFRTATAAEIRERVRGLAAPTGAVYFSIPIGQTDEVSFHPAYAYRDAVDMDFVERLAGSIARLGQVHPIQVMPDRRTIIDGRKRFLACVCAGVSPWCRVWEGGASLDDIFEVIWILHDTFQPYTEYERHRAFEKTLS